MVNGKHADYCSLWTTTAGYYHCSSSAKSALVFLFSLFSSWKKLQRVGSGNNLQVFLNQILHVFHSFFFHFESLRPKSGSVWGFTNHKSPILHYLCRPVKHATKMKKVQNRRLQKVHAELAGRFFIEIFLLPFLNEPIHARRHYHLCH